MHFILSLIDEGVVVPSPLAGEGRERGGFTLPQPPPVKGGGDLYYHLPCHVLALGGSATPRVLKALCGIEVTELKAGCCGLAGTFGMQTKNRALSESIAQKLKETLARAKAKEVVTECAACGMQIEEISRAKALHPIKMIARCLQTGQEKQL